MSLQWFWTSQKANQAAWVLTCSCCVVQSLKFLEIFRSSAHIKREKNLKPTKGNIRDNILSDCKSTEITNRPKSYNCTFKKSLNCILQSILLQNSHSHTYGTLLSRSNIWLQFFLLSWIKKRGRQRKPRWILIGRMSPFIAQIGNSIFNQKLGDWRQSSGIVLMRCSKLTESHVETWCQKGFKKRKKKKS